MSYLYNSVVPAYIRGDQISPLSRFKGFLVNSKEYEVDFNITYFAELDPSLFLYESYSSYYHDFKKGLSLVFSIKDRTEIKKADAVIIVVEGLGRSNPDRLFAYTLLGSTIDKEVENLELILNEGIFSPTHEDKEKPTIPSIFT